jgi:NADH:ubiquinone oxidoreductase subunit 6 (subunit J)
MVDVTDAVFIAAAVVTVGGAIAALEAREIIYGAVGLAGSFFGVASLFFLLDAPFVAVFQITVYIGAVAVLILFTVMLVREEGWFRDSPKALAQAAGVVTMVALALSLVLSFTGSALSNAPLQASAPSFVGIGQILTGQFGPILEVLALVLAASVLGAMALAKVEREGPS